MRPLLIWTALVALAMPAGGSCAEPELRGVYRDDFVLETTDGMFQLRIRGNLHLDMRVFLGPDRGAPLSFDLRRGRIDLQGHLFRVFSFRLQPELAGTPYLRNAWVDFGPVDAFHVRAGQMKIPFSSSWATLDNNVNFIERGASSPLYPFFDRGVKVWGALGHESVVWSLGVFTGAGIDADYGSGDQDDFKDLAGRLFLQPFRTVEAPGLQGIFVVAEGTWGLMSVPTARAELKGYRAADYETALWRWRTEQTIGTDGRVLDAVRATAGHRYRWGLEVHYLLGPLAISGEYLELHYSDIALTHGLTRGSTTLAEQPVLDRDGWVRSLSVFASVYLTGDAKRLTDSGWKTAKPRRPVHEGGPGAVELLVRYSRTWTDPDLFDAVPVAGFAPDDPALPADYEGTTPGAGNGVTAAVLEGAHDVHEWTIGTNWTLNNMVRLQVNGVLLWAPSDDRDGDGANDNLLCSGALSRQADPARKGQPTSLEGAVTTRLIFKL